MDTKPTRLKTESVWYYPRPPRLEKTDRRIEVTHRGVTVASTTRAIRVLETSHPPTYYIPADDVRMELLVATRDQTFCEWKGRARYFDLAMEGTSIAGVAWTYPEPSRGYEELAGHLAFYAHKVDACYVDDERVESQAGSFYGGWITKEIVGPFKGARGTEGW